MCFNQGAFLLVQGESETPLDNVATVIPGKESLKLIDVYGKIREVAGSIEEIDFLNNRIVLG